MSLYALHMVSKLIDNEMSYSANLNLAGGDFAAGSEAELGHVEGGMGVVPGAMTLTNLYGKASGIGSSYDIRADNELARRQTRLGDTMYATGLNTRLTGLGATAASSNSFTAARLNNQMTMEASIRGANNERASTLEAAKGLEGPLDQLDDDEYKALYPNGPSMFGGHTAAEKAAIMGPRMSANQSRRQGINSGYDSLIGQYKKLNAEQNRNLGIESERITGNTMANAWEMAHENNFRPVQGALTGILGRAGSDFNAFQERSKNGVDLNDVQMTLANLEVNRQEIFSQKKDLFASILGGRAEHMGGFMSAMSFADPMQENFNTKAGAIGGSIQQIERLIKVMSDLAVELKKKST